MIDNLSKKLNFTKDEIKIILFLLLVVVTGIAFNLFVKASSSKTDYKTFNYAKEDSLFFNAGYTEEELQTNERDSVLNLANNQASSTFNKKELAALNSVNINSAGLSELCMLPGIGEKTAQLIIEYRSRKGKFGSIDELDKIKGIGAKKLEKIKPFVKL